MMEHGTFTEPGTVRLERTLPGPIDRVWAYLTESEKRKKWLAAGDIELRAGGTVTLVFDHTNLSHEKETPEKYRASDVPNLSGRVTQCEPPHLLSYTWNYRGEESEVSFELSEKGSEVQLILTHRRLPSREMAGFAAGWHAHLGVLADNLKGETPRGFWSALLALEQDYEKRIQLMKI